MKFHGAARRLKTAMGVSRMERGKVFRVCAVSMIFLSITAAAFGKTPRQERAALPSATLASSQIRPQAVPGEKYQICTEPQYLTSPWTYDGLASGSQGYTVAQYE